MNASEHYDWAVARAKEYVDMGDGGSAVASLVSDFGKHPGTQGLLTEDLTGLFMAEVIIGGAPAAGRFIDGILRPAVAA